MIRRTGRRGAHIVEFAVIAIVLFMFLFAILEYGRFVMMRDLIDNAAQRGVRAAIVNTDFGVDSEIQAVVQANLAGQKFSTLKVTTYKVDSASGENLGAWKNASFGTPLAVKVEADFSTMFPTLGLLPNPVKMRAVSVMRSEGK